MTGLEHYRTAEILLGNLRDEMAGVPGKLLRTPEQQAQMIAEAQVHATLALAAATAADRLRIPQGDGTEYDVAVAGPAPSWAEVTA